MIRTARARIPSTHIHKPSRHLETVRLNHSDSPPEARAGVCRCPLPAALADVQGGDEPETVEGRGCRLCSGFKLEEGSRYMALRGKRG